MSPYIQTSINYIVARAVSLQQSMILYIVMNSDEDSCSYLGDVLEQVAELTTELVKLQSFLKAEIKEPVARSDPVTPGT